jgi:hypothetical protein
MFSSSSDEAECTISAAETAGLCGIHLKGTSMRLRQFPARDRIGA